MNSFIPSDFIPPSEYHGDDYHLFKLSPKWLDLDYDTIIKNLEHLYKTPSPPVCGFWPANNISKEDDLKDLKWHEEVHDKREIFAYTIINDAKDKCIGCFYIFPSTNPNYDAFLYIWTTEELASNGYEDKLIDELSHWVTKEWGINKFVLPGRDVDYEICLDESNQNLLSCYK